MIDHIYESLVNRVLQDGYKQEGRNGAARSIFGYQFSIDGLRKGYFPILRSRQIFYKGVLGELAAMIRKPQHVDDFKKWGCNFWDSFADADGSLRLDYGNRWDLQELRSNLAKDPHSRRHLVTAWPPSDNVSLPCCHYSYQFYVNNEGLHMIWIQRSVDVMVGLPSNVVFASAFLIALAKDLGYEPGIITFQLGNCHIYEEHTENAKIQIARDCSSLPVPRYKYAGEGDFTKFTPDMLELEYAHLAPLKFELKT